MIFSDIVGIIADDLTGANDTALQFHLRGANTKILLDSEYIPINKGDTEVWAISTESRNIACNEAVEKVEAAVKSFVVVSKADMPIEQLCTMSSQLSHPLSDLCCYFNHNTIRCKMQGGLL